MKIAIVGLGAVGVSLAKRLVEHGLPVVGFTRSPVKTYRIREESRTSTLKIEAHREPRKNDLGAYDLVMFTLKNHILAEHLERYLPLLSPTGSIVCAQNGLMEYFIAKHVPEDRILGCLVKGNSIYTPPDTIEITMPVQFAVGPLRSNGATSGNASEVLQLFSRQGIARTVPEILSFKWSKLVFSAMVNPLSAITGLDAYRMLRNPQAVEVGLGIVDEVITAADSERIKLQREGVMTPYFFRKNGIFPMTLKRLFIGLFALTLRGLKVSMLQDIESGRATEVDFINGFIVDLGTTYNFPAPFNQRTCSIVKMLESGRLRPSLENLSLYDGVASGREKARALGA